MSVMQGEMETVASSNNISDNSYYTPELDCCSDGRVKGRIIKSGSYSFDRMLGVGLEHLKYLLDYSHAAELCACLVTSPPPALLVYILNHITRITCKLYIKKFCYDKYYEHGQQ